MADLTPREKVVAILDEHTTVGGTSAYRTGQVNSDELAGLILTALASGSGDHAELARLAEAVEWRPIETAPRDGTIIQRPHRTWGAMSVRHKRRGQSEEFLRGFSWMSADYSALWPESAFLPFWLPLPPAPGAEA